jgi:hypothetical protein
MMLTRFHTLWLGLILAGCGSTAASKPVVEIEERFPPRTSLAVALPGSVGPEGTARAAAFKHVADVSKAIAELDLLEEYLKLGGTEERDLTITVALEGAPRVVDQVVRYLRDRSRLDVERVGDHLFFYLQADQGAGFDPDHAIGESRMLIEGSTVLPRVEGERATRATATGLSDVNRGYLRFHFNHRPTDTSAVHSAVQLDYRLKAEVRTLHFTYTIRPDTKESEPTLGLYLIAGNDGAGLLYVSRRKAGNPSYALLAQYRGDGSMAVWSGDGKLWGCSDGSGTELGNASNPQPCDGFSSKFTAPPSGPKIWPGLPAGVPK